MKNDCQSGSSVDLKGSSPKDEGVPKGLVSNPLSVAKGSKESLKYLQKCT